MLKTPKDHWNDIYSAKDHRELGWYQEEPQPDLLLIEELKLPKDAKILIVGGGASTLVDGLVERGYTNLICTDISEMGLALIKQRNPTANIRYIVDDLSDPSELLTLQDIDLWVDRAVLHFLTDTEQVKSYVSLAKNSVRDKGYIQLAEFASNGALKCSGLAVKRYSAEDIQSTFGSQFKLLKTQDYLYTMPNGDQRPYLYAVLQSTGTGA